MGTFHDWYWWAIGVVEAHPHLTLIYTALITAWTAWTSGSSALIGVAGLAWAACKYLVGLF